MSNVIVIVLVIVAPIATCVGTLLFAGKPAESDTDIRPFVGLDDATVEAFASAHPVNRDLCRFERF